MRESSLIRARTDTARAENKLQRFFFVGWVLRVLAKKKIATTPHAPLYPLRACLLSYSTADGARNYEGAKKMRKGQNTNGTC